VELLVSQAINKAKEVIAKRVEKTKESNIIKSNKRASEMMVALDNEYERVLEEQVAPKITKRAPLIYEEDVEDELSILLSGVKI
jgi:hypothetical protein